MKRKTILVILFSIILFLISIFTILLLFILGFLNNRSKPCSDIDDLSNNGNRLFPFEIVEDSDICIKKILDGEIDVSEYTNKEIYLSINYEDGVCSLLQVSENDYLRKIMIKDIELGNSKKTVVYTHYPYASTLELKTYIKLENNVYLNSTGLSGDNGFVFSNNQQYLLIKGSQYYIVNCDTLSIEILDLEDYIDDNTSLVGNSPIWSNEHLLFAFVNTNLFTTFKDDQRDYGIQYLIYDLITKNVTILDNEKNPDFRFCAAACPYEVYIYGSWGMLGNDIFYYTTYQPYNWDLSEDGPSKYGIKFVNIKNKEILYEQNLKEYTYPEENLRHLEHYLCEIEIDDESLEWDNSTPIFRYRFKYPIDDDMDTVWTEWENN